MNTLKVSKKIFIKYCVLAGFLTFCASTIVLSQTGLLKIRDVPSIPDKIFGPSNASTENGKYIQTQDFIPASRCANCHQETHKQWSESLHRNAGREPYYKASVNILEKKRGIEFTRHCESCHSPATMFSGALVQNSKQSRVLDEEGVSCAVCHSITDVSPLGTGSYTIRPPYLLLDENGNGAGNKASDKEILGNIPDHKRAVMNPTLQKPEFCGACHKSNAPPELNNYKFIRGFSTYDEWQQSGASRETVSPFYAKEKRLDCRSCHMPPIESLNDAAAKNGAIKSHRWLGANTAVPKYYGNNEQAELTTEFLKNNVLSADIFAVKKVSTGELSAPLIQKSDNVIKLQPGEELITDVVIFNRGAAHSFPPELRDLYEPWVEFEVVNKSDGKTIFHSGYVKPNGNIDEKAHTYKSILLDETGKSLTRHQVWLGTAKAYDAFIPSGRADLVRYRFRVPFGTLKEKIILRVKVNYRRYIQEYAEYVSSVFKEPMPNPIVLMTETEVYLKNETKGYAEKSSGDRPKNQPSSFDPKTVARRWNDYGIGLLGQSQYGSASEAFGKAAEIDPSDSNLFVNAAIAELQTERYGPELSQFAKAKLLIEKALSVNSQNDRVNYYWALIKRAEGANDEAARILKDLANKYPNDREVQRQLGQTLYRLGKFDEARKAFSEVSRIDPTDSGAYQFLSPLLASAGRLNESREARNSFLLWRDDPWADVVANRFYSVHPEWADVRVPGKIYSEESPHRPTLTNENAAAER